MHAVGSLLVHALHNQSDQNFPDQNGAGFHFEGMCWEGKAGDATLVGTPSMCGASLRLSLGEKWGKSLATEAFGGVFAR